MARKYEHNAVVTATIDGEPGVRAVRVQDNPEYGFWLAQTSKPGSVTRFDREVTDIEPLVSFAANDIDALIDAINLGETQLAVDTLKEALSRATPVVLEPLGLGAVVVDYWGEQFVRIPASEGDTLPWYSSTNGHFVGWADITDPEVESAGAPVPTTTPVPATEPSSTTEPTPA